MASALVQYHPAVEFSRLFALSIDKFGKHFEESHLEDEEVDFVLVWWLSFAAAVVRNAPGTEMLRHRQTISEFIAKIVRFKSTKMIKMAADFVQCVLYSLCSVYPKLKPYHSRPFVADHLSIRHWAVPVGKNKWSMEWHVPSDEEVDYAQTLADEYILAPLEQLQKDDDGRVKSITDKQLLNVLTIAFKCFEACSALCPLFDEAEAIVDLTPTALPNVKLDIVAVPRHVKRLVAKEGGNNVNFRRQLFILVQKLGDHLLNERENDSRSIIALLNVVSAVIFSRGIEQKNFLSQMNAFNMTKQIFNDPLRGQKEAVESIVDGTLITMHMFGSCEPRAIA